MLHIGTPTCYILDFKYVLASDITWLDGTKDIKLKLIRLKNCIELIDTYIASVLHSDVQWYQHRVCVSVNCGRVHAAWAQT